MLLTLIRRLADDFPKEDDSPPFQRIVTNGPKQQEAFRVERLPESEILCSSSEGRAVLLLVCGARPVGEVLRQLHCSSHRITCDLLLCSAAPERGLHCAG